MKMTRPKEGSNNGVFLKNGKSKFSSKEDGFCNVEFFIQPSNIGKIFRSNKQLPIFMKKFVIYFKKLGHAVAFYIQVNKKFLSLAQNMVLQIIFV